MLRREGSAAYMHDWGHRVIGVLRTTSGFHNWMGFAFPVQQGKKSTPHPKGELESRRDMYENMKKQRHRNKTYMTSSAVAA
eukprot:1161106-Pelagomonas_calceolata.AAC.15